MAERRDKKNVNSNDKTVVDSNVKNVSQEEQVQSRNLRTEEQKSAGKSESKENVVPKLEQKEEQVEAETLRNTRDVRKVKDELKREKMFNSFNGWLSIITFGLLVLAIFSVYIYGTSVSAKNKMKFSELRADGAQIQEKVQSLGESFHVASLGLRNATNQIHELEEKINSVEKEQIAYKSKIDIALANLKSNTVEPKVEPLDFEKYALTEAHYLIKMSFRKMYLEKDIPTAIALLKDANNVLARVDEPNFLRIQQSINNDIIKLNKIETVESEGLILRLSALDENIKTLPVLGYKVNFGDVASSEENAADSEVTENIDDWKENVLSNASNFLGKLVVVRKNDDNVDRLFLTKDQIIILQDKISMFLLQAQLAVYAQQQTVYEQSLNKVSDLINGYFDKEDSTTEHALIEINELKSMNVLFIGLQQYESLDVIQRYLMSK